MASGERGAGASFYTVAEVSEHYGKSTRRVLQLIEAGAIPAQRFGRSLRVPKAQWDAIRGLSAGGISMADAGGPEGIGLLAAMTRDQAKAYLLALARQARARAESAAEALAEAERNFRESERLWRQLVDDIDQLPGGPGRVGGGGAVA